MRLGCLQVVSLGLQASCRRVSSATMSTGRPKLRGVVFDMDGTLTKPNLDFREMYSRCNVDMSEDILAAIDRKPPAEGAAAQAVVDEMEEEGRRTLQLMPGVSGGALPSKCPPRRSVAILLTCLPLMPGNRAGALAPASRHPYGHRHTQHGSYR